MFVFLVNINLLTVNKIHTILIYRTHFLDSDLLVTSVIAIQLHIL